MQLCRNSADAIPLARSRASGSEAASAASVQFLLWKRQRRAIVGGGHIMKRSSNMEVWEPKGP